MKYYYCTHCEVRGMLEEGQAKCHNCKSLRLQMFETVKERDDGTFIFFKDKISYYQGKINRLTKEIICQNG